MMSGSFRWHRWHRALTGSPRSFGGIPHTVVIVRYSSINTVHTCTLRLDGNLRWSKSLLDGARRFPRRLGELPYPALHANLQLCSVLKRKLSFNSTQNIHKCCEIEMCSVNFFFFWSSNMAQISKLRTFFVLCGGMVVGSTVVHKVRTLINV